MTNIIEIGITVAIVSLVFGVAIGYFRGKK